MALFVYPLPQDLARIVLEYAVDPPCVPIKFAENYMLIMAEIDDHNYDYEDNVNMLPSRVKEEGPPTGHNTIDAYFDDPHGQINKRHLIQLFSTLQRNGICVKTDLLAAGYSKTQHVAWPYRCSYVETEPTVMYKCSHQTRVSLKPMTK